MSRATVNVGFLSAFDGIQHVGDEVLLIEIRERRENPGCITLTREKGWVECSFAKLILFERLQMEPALYINTAFVALFFGWLPFRSLLAFDFLELLVLLYFVFQVKSVLSAHEASFVLPDMME